MPLTSPQNPLLARVRRAVDSGRPLNDGSIAAEGPHLLQEALNGAWKIQHILCSQEGLERHRSLLASVRLPAGQSSIEITEVGERAFKTLSDTEQTQGVISLLFPHRYSWQEVVEADGPLVILDGLQDPGNVGAIIRSAEAFGCSGVVFTEGCVRVSNGKLLRASAGSLFRLPFLESCGRRELVAQTRAAKRTIFSLSPSGGSSLFETNLNMPFAVVVGSEGMGISPELREAGQALSVPTRKVESLNAAVACSVTLFEAARQRTERRTL